MSSEEFQFPLHKRLHHFVQRLFVPFVRQQVANPQFLMRSQQNCSKQEVSHPVTFASFDA